MVKLKDIFSATNIMILIIMAGGNFIFDIAAHAQEFQRMNCVREAIYENATEDHFTSCLKNAGFFDNNITWGSFQFILILISILVTYLIERKK